MWLKKLSQRFCRIGGHGLAFDQQPRGHKTIREDDAHPKALSVTQRFRERIRGPWIEVRGSVEARVDQVLARMFSRT